jgi:uncharacterized protein (DUF1330 family)
MALAMNAHRRALYETQQRIFIKLCAAFRRSRQNPGFRLLIENVRAELNIPVSLFTEALENFSDAGGEPIVVVIEHNGERYITLGESAKSNVSDWADTPRAVIGFRSLTPAESKGVTNGRRYAEAAIKTH